MLYFIPFPHIQSGSCVGFISIRFYSEVAFEVAKSETESFKTTKDFKEFTLEMNFDQYYFLSILYLRRRESRKIDFSNIELRNSREFVYRTSIEAIAEAVNGLFGIGLPLVATPSH